MKPKLSVFCHALNIDGATMVVMHALGEPRIKSIFSTIEIISPSDGPMKEKLRKLGYKVTILDYKTGSLKAAVKRLLKLNFLAFFKVAHFVLRSDVVWVNSIDHPAWLFALLAFTRKKGLYYFHEGLRSQFSRHFLSNCKRRHIKKAACFNNVTVAFPSKTTCADGAAALELPDVSYLPYGISNVTVEPNKTNRTETIEFVSVGWICERKGQFFLASVLQELLTLVNKETEKYFDFKITFLGVDHKSNHEFIKEFSTIFPPSKSRFIGQIPNELLLARLSKFDCLISNSFNEALPVNVLEFLARGGLVVASRCEGQDELVIDGQTGHSFEVGDFSDLFQKLTRVITREERDRNFQLASAGKKHIEENYSMAIFTQKLERALIK